jgi:integrase
MSKKVEITDKLAKSLVEGGEPRDIMDIVQPGFGIRVGLKRSTYILLARFPGSDNPTRRGIAQVGSIALKAARAMALDWKEKLLQGIDPVADKLEKAEAAAVQRKYNSETFSTAAEEYITLILSQQKNGAEIGRSIRTTFYPTLKDRPITKITTQDIAKPIKAKALTHKAQAFNIRGYVLRMFEWAEADGKIPQGSSPCKSIKPRVLLGRLDRRIGKQLTEAELRKIWVAAKEMGYPYGPLFQLLLLTGVRHMEAANASWSEFDLKAKLWTIPAKRMKGRKAGEDHLVPLTPMMLDILNKLPKLGSGDYLFSTKDGRTPTSINTFPKEQMDKLAHLYDWRNHDLRTSMRSYLSPLPIHSTNTVDVRELMIAHKIKGIGGVYDKHGYLDEKRIGFELWEQRLAGIVGHTPPKLTLVAS